MSRILLLTYMFPPAGGIGTPRALAYARHLPRLGCRLSVLAPTKPALRDEDPELKDLIPQDVPVHRAWNPEPPISLRDRIWKHGILTGAPASGTRFGSPKRMSQPIRWVAQRLLFPDPQILWTPWAVREACRIIERDSIDTLIVNMPPFSLLKAGVALKRRFPHLKLIFDFRDEWLGYYLHHIDRPTEDKIRRARDLEGGAIEAATYVSTVTETWAARLRHRYPDAPAEKFICTPNGYDPEVMAGFQPRPRKNGKIVVTYFGTIHENKVYSPANYLAALDSMPKNIRDRFETRFIGRIVGGAGQSLEKTKADIRLLGFMPRHDGLRQLQDTDFALLIATDPSSHAGKLFDYVGCRKPIFALSPLGGEIDRLLRRTRTGWCADPWSPAAIREMILAGCRQLAQKASPFNPDVNAIEEYSWPQIFARFAESVQLATAACTCPQQTDVLGLPMSVGA